MKMEKAMRIMAKTCVVLLFIVAGYWGKYFYDEMQYKKEKKEWWKDYNSRPTDTTTRGGYAQPSKVEIPNTLRPDTLKSWNY